MTILKALYNNMLHISTKPLHYSNYSDIAVICDHLIKLLNYLTGEILYKVNTSKQGFLI